MVVRWLSKYENRYLSIGGDRLAPCIQQGFDEPLVAVSSALTDTEGVYSRRIRNTTCADVRNM
jgi:hypothetical protein